MKPVECEFESEVLRAALQARWPERVDADLRTHVAGCAICADVIVVAAAVEEAREEMRARAVVPDSGRVWWRAQLRARREAAEAAGRPITAVQVMAFGCAAGLLCGCFGAVAALFQPALGWIAGAGVDVRAFFAFAAMVFAEHGALVIAMAAVVFLVPAAVYLAMGDNRS